MKPRATWHDAYDAQMGLWRWVRTPLGFEWMKDHYVDNAEGLNRDTQEMLGALYHAEQPKLLTAEPVFVSAEMCEVIDAAMTGFHPEPLYSTDLITQSGFCWFEKPFTIPDRFDKLINLRAWSWGWLELGDADPDPDNFQEGLAVTLYVDLPESPPGRFRAGLVPPVLPIHICPWWFGMTFDGNEWDEIGVPTGAAWWWKIAQTTLRLMQQRITVQHRERPLRASRREGQRMGWNAPTDERDVLVVRLRREQSERHDPSGEAANYSHRFIVGGHWRNQWYPSGQVHRQIWISPYVKGPEDAPLIVKPRRAFTWDR